MPSSQEAIPKTQLVAYVETAGAPVEFKTEYPVPELAAGECLVKMECTGVCHSDLHAQRGDWTLPPRYPVIGGHEGVGTVVEIGEHTAESPVKIGDRVGIKWNAYCCLNCVHCRKGLEMHCVKAKSSGYTIPGTFQQYVKSWVHCVTPIPANVSSEEVAALLCAGVTIYKAIKRSDARLGDWVVIPGSGGGLGHLGVQYAKEKGLRVIAIDTGEEKRQLSLSLGAELFIDFKETQDLVATIKQHTGGLGAQAAIIAAGAESAYEQALNYLQPTGAMVLVGIPPKGSKLNSDIFTAVVKGMSILGSPLGTRQDAIEAIDLVARGKVKVHHKTREFSELPRVLEEMGEGKIVGRIVLKMPA